MYQQVLDPVSDSLGLSSIFAVLPLLTLFVLLGGFRMKAQWAGLISLAVAVVIAVAVYGMPVGVTFNAALLGAVFGLIPIMWIVVNAVWIYNMTVKTGHFAVLRRSFGAISNDQRIQAIVIAFAFGALLEALAGFGTPVAITSVMLVALGFSKMKAVCVALVANTAPVAFGALAIPIVTASELTTIPLGDLGAMVGRQTPLVAMIVPFILVGMVDGFKGIRAVWPAAIVGGLTFAIGQFLCANYVSVQLTDIVASLLSAGSIVLLMRVWQPGEPLTGEAEGGPKPAIAGASGHDPALEAAVRRRDQEHDSRREVIEAYSPYLIIIGLFAIAQLFFKDFIDEGMTPFAWPGLDITNPAGEALTSTNYNPNSSWTGSILLISGVLTAIVLRVRASTALRTAGETLDQLKWAILTVAAVLALAYVMNLSGQTITLGTWIAGAGAAFAFLSPVLGWLGTAVTGSDTSSNALFAALQVTAGERTGISQNLLVAANSSGGVMGKMVSPQNLAIGVAAVGMAGKEGDVLRKVVGWSFLMLLAVCVLVYLQSTPVLDWMVVDAAPTG
ncbi:L-lactate permease [Thermoleophilia bacterium SCSIO 60948]|nr:L-lactate permease [Thermoleophilia bacterium SCSIO 60948]